MMAKMFDSNTILTAACERNMAWHINIIGLKLGIHFVLIQHSNQMILIYGKSISSDIIIACS